MTLWVDEGYPYVMVFTGDPLPDVAAAKPRGRADDLPAERVPQRRGLVVLEPEASFSSTWGISVIEATT